jgi:hypothetical protein
MGTVNSPSCPSKKKYKIIVESKITVVSKIVITIYELPSQLN